MNSAISILYTGDVHARVEQFLRAAFIAQQQRATLKAEGISSLLVDAGDVEDRSLLESDISKGAAMFQLLKAAGYDCSAVGNGAAIAYGPPCFDAIAQISHLPILCANILTQETPPNPLPGMTPVLIQQVGPVKVGLIGLTVTYNRLYERLFGYYLPSPQDTVRHHARALRDAGCQVVGLISHLGYDDDLQLADALATEIDFLIGGHSHTTLEKPDNVQDIPVCHAGDYGRYVGQLDLVLGSPGKVTHWSGHLIPVPEEGQVHVQAERMWHTIKIDIQRQLGAPIGYLTDALDLAKDRACGMGQLLADALRARMHADVALCASGHLRGELPAGAITFGDVIAACGSPGNPTVTNLTGADILSLLEHGANPETWQKLINHRDGAIGIIQVSGITYRIDFNAPTGQRVSEVHILDNPIDLDAIYVVASTDFEFNRTIGYLPNLDENLVTHDVSLIMREVLIEHLERFNPLVPDTQPRIAVTGKVYSPLS